MVALIDYNTHISLIDLEKPYCFYHRKGSVYTAKIKMWIKNCKRSLSKSKNKVEKSCLRRTLETLKKLKDRKKK